MSVISLVFMGWSKLLFIPASDAFLFVVWMLSLSICGYFEFLRLSLQNEKKSQVISMVRKSFTETRMIITDLDQSMALVFKYLYNDSIFLDKFLIGNIFLIF